MKRYPLNTQQSQDYAHSTGLILSGFVVSPDHSIVLCEQGKEYVYSRKRPDQRTTPDAQPRGAVWP